MNVSLRRRLRLGRTLFVHRWHAAQTIGEWFGNEAVGERFEHVNHARSLAQYIWNHPQGSRVAVEATGRASRSVVTAGALVDGAHRQFAIRDRALAAMLQSIDEPPFPALFRWLAAFKTFVSATITAMPVFIVKNFFRDTLAGFVAGRYFQWPFLGTLAGACHAFHDMAGGRSGAMREYLLQGGFYSGLVESETDLGPARKESGALRQAAAVKQKWGVVVHVATRPAWLAEAGTRVNQFQRARRAGATNYAAARAARMVSSDFANIGASRAWRMYVHTVPFLNAAIQGIDQLYQVLRSRFRAEPAAPRWSLEQRRHVRKAALAGLCLAGASGAAWQYNTSDPVREAAYKAETEYDKASWVTLYDVVGDADVRIPVPFQIGAAFIKVPEIAFDLAAGTETLAGVRYAWSLVHGNLWMGWKPAVVQPMIEVYTNKNFFGSEIIPSYMRNWPPESQFFRRSTPLPYRRAGELLGVSPLHVQTVWRGWTGHLGNLAVVFLDERMWDETANGPKPFLRTTRLLTGLYSLRAPMPRTYTRYGNEFYDIADWADANVRGRNCRASSLPIETSSACRANTVTNRVARHASRLRSAGDEVRTDPTRTRASKEAELIAIYEEIDAVFREVLPEIRELRRRGGG